MNFDLSEEQQVISDLAAQLFGDLAAPERVAAVADADGFDRELWVALADAGLLALCLPESVGGSGMGIVEMCLMAEQQGRKVAAVPLVPTIAVAITIAEHLEQSTLATSLLAGLADGSTVLTAALAGPGVNDALRPSLQASESDDGIRIIGGLSAVPALPAATAVLVPVMYDGDVALALVATDTAGVEIETLSTTNHEMQGHLDLDVTIPTEQLITNASALDDLYHRWLVGNCAIQLGVGAGAIEYVGQHVSTREQFGRPLSTFQAVSQRAADSFITNEALRWSVLNAAWGLANEGTESSRAHVLTAAYWASEGTQQVVLAAQHLHAGIGADVEYPVHRHFLWGMQYASTLGTASSHLARLGKHITKASA